MREHWGVLETAKKIGQNRKPHTKPSENRYNVDKCGVQSKLH